MPYYSFDVFSYVRRAFANLLSKRIKLKAFSHPGLLSLVQHYDQEELQRVYKWDNKVQ